MPTVAGGRGGSGARSESFRVRLIVALHAGVSISPDLPPSPVMDLLGREVSDPGMIVARIVPLPVVGVELPGFIKGLKGGRVVGVSLHRAERGLGEWIIVRDVWPRVAHLDSAVRKQIVQQAGSHRRTIVRMDYPRDTVLCECRGEQVDCGVRVLGRLNDARDAEPRVDVGDDVLLERDSREG